MQEHNFGCGAACASFVSGKTYSEVVNLLGKNKARKTGFDCKDLIGVLLKFGKNYSFNYIKTRLRSRIYEDGTIVFIKRSKRYPHGHYLVRYKKLWMDSWISFTKDENIAYAKAGFRKRLPGKPIYIIFPEQ